MMTDRWINIVLAVLVPLGLLGVAVYNQPRDRAERAEFLDQELAELDGDYTPPDREDRDPIELQRRPDAAEATEPQLGVYGVSASKQEAVDVGMEVLEGGGNAVDAAIAVAYALGVVEPFGSGIGGGGALLVQPADGEPSYYDYREIAPRSGEPPASDIGVPGFVAGMEHIHDQHGTVDLPDLIEYAARLAEDGIEVDDYLNERLRGAAHRMPIHLLPRFYPNGGAIPPGETLYQPEYAEALRMIQDQGAAAMYGGELAELIAEEVDGLEVADFRGYEVEEYEPAVGTFAGYEVLGAGAPVAAPTVIQLLQVAEALGVNELDMDSADWVHGLAQAWRVANAQRVDDIGDPGVEQVDLARLLSPATSRQLADRVPADGFASVDEEEQDDPGIETDTTQVVVVDAEGTMVSFTNTLSNFFGSGLPVSGFFLNDQLKNFSPRPDSINAAGPQKRPRSFIAPMIVRDDQGRPVLGIGSPGGRRIPNIVAQVLTRWAGHEQSLEEAVVAPRFHLEGRTLELEEELPGGEMNDLQGRGYELTTWVPTTEYYGGVQALRIDWDAGEIEGVEDTRRVGTFATGSG